MSGFMDSIAYNRHALDLDTMRCEVRNKREQVIDSGGDDLYVASLTKAMHALSIARIDALAQTM